MGTFNTLIAYCFFAISLLAIQPVDVKEDHAIYIGVIKVVHKENASTAIAHVRVFTDDLTSALRNKFGYEEIKAKDAFCTDYEGFIQGYFEEYFSIKVNQKSIAYALTDCQRAEDVYQLAFEMDCPEKWENVQIKAPFFMELFPNQSNVIHLIDNDNKRFGRIKKGNEILEINIK